MAKRYFITAEATYEILRQTLNAQLGYPNNVAKSIFHTPLQAPRDSFRRVLLAVDLDLDGYSTVNAAITPLLAGDSMEELDEATYLTALASAGAASPEEVVEYTTPADFPATGNSSLLYIATDNARAYRWVGSQYAEVGPTSLFMQGHTHAASDIVSGTIAAARIGAHASSHNPGGADQINLAQTFTFTRSSAPATATGSAGLYSWTIPAGARAISIDATGGGGGGGSGRRGAAGAVRTGGSGGAGGSRSLTTLNVEELVTTALTVNVGRGGAGGAAVTADDNNGNAGESNIVTGTSWVRYNQNVYTSSSTILQAGGGSGGSGGTNANVNGGIGWAGTFAGGAGGGAITTGGSTAPEVLASPSGGGGGGAVYANGSSSNGGGGGRISMFSATAFGGSGGAAGNIGTAGGNAPAITLLVAGQGGGGGGSGSSGAGGGGGDGAFPGGGGGGGGASPNGFASGAGGNGADGVVRITVWF